LSTPQDPFDALLAWLDPDRDIAAEKYETIRKGLIRIFGAKGFSRPEDMADEAFRRASERLPDQYVGERSHYFRGFARNLIREGYRPKEIATDELISKGALRIRVHHLRVALEKCVVNCTQTLRTETKPVPADIVSSGAKTRSVKHGRGSTT
jgi:hypothetical protein